MCVTTSLNLNCFVSRHPEIKCRSVCAFGCVVHDGARISSLTQLPFDLSCIYRRVLNQRCTRPKPDYHTHTYTQFMGPCAYPYRMCKCIQIYMCVCGFVYTMCDGFASIQQAAATFGPKTYMKLAHTFAIDERT